MAFDFSKTYAIASGIIDNTTVDKVAEFKYPGTIFIHDLKW